MNSSTRQLLVLDYLSKFKCTGTTCEDTCCIGWTIYFDKQTVQLYKDVKDPELGDLLRSEIVQRQGENLPQSAVAEIRLDPDTGRCPFLSTKNLCRIQEKLGEEYLGCTCARYPRQDSSVDGNRERALTLSCPEAARLILLSKTPLQMEMTTVPISRCDYLFHRKIDTIDLPAIEGYKAYFWRIRELIISALQKRSLPLIDRLLMVGVLCQTLEQIIKDGNYPLIGEHLDAFQQNLTSSNELAKAIAAVQTRTEFQLTVLRAISAKRFESGISHERFAKCAREFAESLLTDPHASEEEYLQHYQAALKTYYLPFMQDHEYMLENWCVNDVFRTLFPFDAQGTIFDQFTLLALKVALVKFYLVGVGAFHKGLTEELVVRVIQSFCRGFEASKTFRENVLGMLESQNIKNLPTLAVLLKNA